MSETPETDAAIVKNIVVDVDRYGNAEAQGEYIEAAFARRLERERYEAREALQRIADCDWVITLPDRMDAVRKIARDALEANK